MRRSETGAALLGALLICLLLTMLGTVSVRLTAEEFERGRIIREEAVVRHLAEAGVQRVIEWFHDPAAAPSDTGGSFFRKRFNNPGAGPSFFDPAGASQFRGTAGNPDVLYDAATPSHDRILNGASARVWGSSHGQGWIQRIALYGPGRSGLLCTVEVTATASMGLARTVAVQLGTHRLPVIRESAQVGQSRVDATSSRTLPIWSHWGDIKIVGDARLEKIEDLPRKTPLAALAGTSYAETGTREDRWLDIYVGGEVQYLPSSAGQHLPPPDNVHARQDPLPGLKLDSWSYEELKQEAMDFGAYYSRGRDGLLYRDGIEESGRGADVATVVRSSTVGDHRGVVFVDTLDRQIPRIDNLGTLTVETDYAEGLFVLNANVRFKPKGTGVGMTALAPPDENGSSSSSRMPSDLGGIHLRGLLGVAGDLIIEGRPHVFGAVVVKGQVISEGPASSILEVWADYELSQGLSKGMPLVFIAPGTWIDKM